MNEKVFIGSSYDMKVLFSRSSEQKLHPKMIANIATLNIADNDIDAHWGGLFLSTF